MYKARLDSRGNPDHGQDPHRRMLGVPVKIVEGETLEELQSKVREWQDTHNVGSGNWVSPKVYKDNQLVGLMSYNGRVFNGR